MKEVFYLGFNTRRPVPVSLTNTQVRELAQPLGPTIVAPHEHSRKESSLIAKKCKPEQLLYMAQPEKQLCHFTHWG